MAKPGMGRGLAAILPETEPTEPGVSEVPVELIVPNPSQPRTQIDPDALDRLAESVAAAGVIQPLLVRPLADGRYELIAGERRWRAARAAGLEAVPALVRSDAEADRLQTALIENVAREDLNPVDEARACAALVEELGLSKEEVARRLARSRAAVSNLIRLLDLPDGALELLATGALSEGHGRAILQARGAEERRGLARAAAEDGWSVRETERRARRGGDVRRRSRHKPDADEAEAIGRAEDALGAALGREVKVRLAGEGLRAELRFADLDELLAAAAEFAARRP